MKKVGTQYSQLFTVRLWLEEIGPDTDDIRFKVQHVLSGDARYARTWADVLEFVMLRFQEHEAATQTAETTHEDSERPN